MAGLSPTQLTLRQLRADNWELVQVVEIWNPHARIRQDLFGIIDVLAVGAQGTLAIQATSNRSSGTVSHRKRKLEESPALPILLGAGWDVRIWGWDKNKSGRWQIGREIVMNIQPKESNDD